MMEVSMAWKENAKTRRFALNMLKVSVAISGAALLFACGDDDSSFVASENGGSAAEADIVVTIFDDLPNCTGKREGVTAYVKDEKTAYVCTDGDWVVDSKDKSSSSVESSSGVIPSSDSESSSSRSIFEMSKDEFLNPRITYGTMTDTRDNKTYKTVKIGTQVWMAENLNYADSIKTPSLKGNSWCYDNKAENCDVTGRLYTWAAAIDSVALANDADNPQICGYFKECTLPTVVQGVCPEGWHLPTKTEWNTLFMAVGGSSAAGKALKSGSGWSDNGNGTDTYGFSALPAGYRNYSGNFYDAGYGAYFWSASENGSSYAYYMRLYYYYEDAYMYYYRKYYGYSVRCLQYSN